MPSREGMPGDERRFVPSHALAGANAEVAVSMIASVLDVAIVRLDDFDAVPATTYEHFRMQVSMKLFRSPDEPADHRVCGEHERDHEEVGGQ